MSLSYSCPCIPLFEFCSLSFQIKGRAQNIHAAESAEEGEHSFQGEVPPYPPRRRGRSRGRPSVAQVLGLVLVLLVVNFIRDVSFDDWSMFQVRAVGISR